MMKKTKNKEKVKLKVRLKNKIYSIYKFIVDWRMAISFIIAWMITNGWAYLFIVFGTTFKIKWMSAVGTSYVAILWLPCTPEKIITIPLSVFIKKILFKKHSKKGEQKNGYYINN